MLIVSILSFILWKKSPITLLRWALPQVTAVFL